MYPNLALSNSGYFLLYFALAHLRKSQHFTCCQGNRSFLVSFSKLVYLFLLLPLFSPLPLHITPFPPHLRFHRLLPEFHQVITLHSFINLQLAIMATWTRFKLLLLMVATMVAMVGAEARMFFILRLPQV